MDGKEYNATAHYAAARFEAGDVAEARALFERIVADPDVPDLDRSMMSVNLATVLTSAGAREAEVEAAYDQAIELERRWMRCFAAEHKVAWLVTIGRHWEARELLVRLRDQPWLRFDERDRIDANLATLS